MSLFSLQVAGGNGAGSTAERLNNPWGIFVDVNGSLFIADRNNHRIQLWESGKSTFDNLQSDIDKTLLQEHSLVPRWLVTLPTLDLTLIN